MEFLIVANMILFLLVTGYAVYQFSYIIKTRYQYIKLGKKVEFDRKFKERFHKIWVMVFGQKKLLKDKKKWNHSCDDVLRFSTCPIRSH